MAPDSKQKKRKSAEQSAPPSSKKAKSSRQVDAAAPKPTEKSAEKTTPRRKRAADFFDGDEALNETVPKVEEPKAKKSKKDKKSISKDEGSQLDDYEAVKVSGIEDKDIWADSDEEDVADQSAALLQGFESSSEEEDDEGADDPEGLAEVPDIPADKKLAKKLQQASSTDKDGPGVIYVGRVPHGFYEHQMRAYFSQFGDITRLRLSRNKKTGRSKHYAFIEFASAEVAKIVAATMNKYLLFGHILQVRLMAPEEIHKDLFKGANKRFKVVPRNKILGRRLRLPMEREGWDKRIANETKRRKEKEEQLKLLGYEFQAPKLKSTKAIPFRKQADRDDELITDTGAVETINALPAPAEDPAKPLLPTKLKPNGVKTTKVAKKAKSKVTAA